MIGAKIWNGTIALTPAGRAELERELATLRDERLPALAALMADAREDMAARYEDIGLLALQEEQHRLERRALELEWLLEVAHGISTPDDGVIALGSRVEIDEDGEHEVFQLVDPRESNVAEGRLSVECPVGRMLLGHAAGDQVVVRLPAGERHMRIVACR